MPLPPDVFDAVTDALADALVMEIMRDLQGKSDVMVASPNGAGSL